MADTEKAAPAATSPAAEVAKTESSKDAGEEKWALNGKSEDRSEHSERRGDRNDRNDRNGRFNDRRGGGGGFRGRGGRGGGGFQNKYKKRNQEFDHLPESDDPVEIRNQVEFYFSTQNLVTDEHLFMELGGPKNMPVSIKHIADFKRMRRFQPYSAIVDALRESKDLVVVDDGDYNGAGKEAVKRKEALVVPKEESDEAKEPSTMDLFYRLKNASSNKLETSVYVKGFGDEKEAGQIALEQFFRPYGSVMVRKRRDDDNSWKGSVFVEFDTEDSQKQLLELDPKPKFNDNELTIMGKREYIIMKCKEKGVEPDFESKKQYNRDGGRGGRGGRGRGRGGNRGGDRRDTRSDRRDRSRDRRDRSGSVDERDWNKRRDRFNNGKDDRGSRKEDKEERKPMETDADGVPVVKDTRTEAEIKKRKAEDDGGEDSKKSKLEIKQDE